MMIKKNHYPRKYALVSYLLIIIFSFLPLLLTFPYRVNLFVTFEGAYRMFLGQVPYKDFGMPVGYGFWLIPFLFFKVFGPSLFSLIKAQAFINFLSFVVLRGIFTLFKTKEAVISLGLLLFGLSFVLINFWPWYNHTVFVYGLIAVYFALCAILNKNKEYFFIFSTLFIWLAILTKQDGGALTFLLISTLLLINSFYSKSLKAWFYYLGGLVVFYLILIVPFLQYDFSYWFNYGQSPHYSRISTFNFFKDIFAASSLLKFYIVVIFSVLLLKTSRSGIKEVLQDRVYVIFTLFTLGILVQAMIIQVTSFSPPTVNYYYHTFAVVYFLHQLSGIINFSKVPIFLAFLLLLVFWKSENYWKYSLPILKKIAPSVFSPPPKDVVSKGNWQAISDEEKPEPIIFKGTDFETLEGLKLPISTTKGIEGILALPALKRKEPQVLNMTNLTFLAREIPYIPESGEHFPLWYHKGVSLFDREVDFLCEQANNETYDLILFEDMPDVNNFFPYEVRDCIQEKYQKVDKFLSPTGYRSDSVEVYIRKRDLE